MEAGAQLRVARYGADAVPVAGQLEALLSETFDEFSGRVWDVYGDKRISRSRMAVSMGKSRVLDAYCTGLASKFSGRSFVVACGVPSFDCCMRGCPAAPIGIGFKTLKRRLPVIPVDEYLTSQACCRCDDKLKAPTKRARLEDGRFVNAEVRGIRLCKKCFLETHGHHAHVRDPGLWPGFARFDRDINAAMNMIRVAGKTNSERPLCLQRPSSITRARAIADGPVS